MSLKRVLATFENKRLFWLVLFCFVMAYEKPAWGKKSEGFLQPPGHRFLVMITERATDFFQFRQDLSLSDKQMLSIREILQTIRREIIQQDAILKNEYEILWRGLLDPVLDKKSLVDQLAVAMDLVQSEVDVWIGGMEELQSVLNKEQMLTYAFIKGVPLPVMEFPQGEYERVARQAMRTHGERYLREKKSLGLREKQEKKLTSLIQQYHREMVSRATFIETGRIEIQDLVSEPVINFDALRKQILENQILRSSFFSAMISYLVKAQDQLTAQQVRSFVQVLSQGREHAE